MGDWFFLNDSFITFFHLEKKRTVGMISWCISNKYFTILIIYSKIYY